MYNFGQLYESLKVHIMKLHIYIMGLAIAVLLGACSQKKEQKPEAVGDCFTNPLFQGGSSPSAVFYKGKYYYTHETNDMIWVWETSDITDMKHAIYKEVWRPTDLKSMHNLWAPEIHRINDKWYIYYAADDGNTDNHQIYVLENEASTPFEGTFVQKGPIMTNPVWNWGIHASTFVHKGVQYLLWSGWPQRRIMEETQCIYIARMKNPWTLEGERVMLSKPEYNWERQWVNPDGSRTAYPIYVNEAPQMFHSKDNKTLILYYSASGCWSPYYCVGMLTADADADLLNPASWHKADKPVFYSSPQDSIWGPGSVSFVPSPDETEWYVLYHARPIPNGITGGDESRSIRMQKVGWDENGMPVLGSPVRLDTPLPKPSGTKSRR